MRIRVSEGVKLLLLIGLPLAAAAISMLWSSSKMLDGISRSVDAQEHARAWDAVQSAFESEQNLLAGMLLDNARWDEAVKNSYGEVNQTWIKDMWGVTTADTNYDLAFVVTPDGKTLAGYREGEKIATGASDYFGPLLARLLERLPKDNASFATSATMAATRDGIAAIAAGPIVPNTGAVKVPAARSNVLIFAHFVTPADLARMSRQFIVDNLKLIPAVGGQRAGSLLTDSWGNPVARVRWKDRRPGLAAREPYALGAFAILIGLIAVLLPLAAVHYRALRRLAQNERQARRAARHDTLSGLPNRLHFSETMAKLFAGIPRPPMALLYVDLDGFKSVNDNYDHETGDCLLRAVATGFRTLAGETATLSRLGGDEFAVLVTGENAKQRAEALAIHILAFVREPFDIGGRAAAVGASIGMAEADGAVNDAAELMRRADIAMYDAKAKGRNQHRWFDPDLDRVRNEEVAIATEMRALLAKGDFEVNYQPIVDAATRRITGVEALARWPRSSFRHLTPDRFIPIAEEHGLIDELGRFILARACSDMAQWQDIKLSVNISLVQINNRAFVKSLERIVATSGFDLSRLEVEFTETVLIRSTERAREVIGELHDRGVSVALDDFGTGFASVGYLRTFHFDKIKLDRSLTQSIMTNVAAQKVVQGTVLIADGLAAEIIAEGVETEEEAQLMRLTGCHKLQGYYFGRPQPVDQIGILLPRESEEPLRAMA